MATAGRTVRIVAPTRPLTDLLGDASPKSLVLNMEGEKLTIFFSAEAEEYDSTNPLHVISSEIFGTENRILNIPIGPGSLQMRSFTNVSLEGDEGLSIRGARCVDRTYFQLAHGLVQLHLKVEVNDA